MSTGRHEEEKRNAAPASGYLTGGRSTEPTPYAAAQSAPRVTTPVLRRATESMSIGDLRRQEYRPTKKNDMFQLMANGIQWHMTNDPTTSGLSDSDRARGYVRQLER